MGPLGGQRGLGGGLPRGSCCVCCGRSARPSAAARRSPRGAPGPAWPLGPRGPPASRPPASARSPAGSAPGAAAARLRSPSRPADDRRRSGAARRGAHGRAARPAAAGARSRAAGRRRAPASGSCRPSGGRRPDRVEDGGLDRVAAREVDRGELPGAVHPHPPGLAPARRGPRRRPGPGRRRGRRCRRGRGRRALRSHGRLPSVRRRPRRAETVPPAGRPAKEPRAPSLGFGAWPPPVRPGWTPRRRRWPASPPPRRTGRRSPRPPASCVACPELAAVRQHVVVGDVPVSGRPLVAFVGEAPGATEDETGRPFVGQVRRPARPAARRGGARPRGGRRPQRREVPAAGQPDPEGARGGPVQRLAAPPAGAARPAGGRGAGAVGGEVVPRARGRCWPRHASRPHDRWTGGACT